MIIPEYGLTFRQPWAWAVVHGGKPLENRKTRVNLRGRFFVHAAAKFDEADKHAVQVVREIYRALEKNVADVPAGPGDPAMPLGGIVGVATITGWTAYSDSHWFFGPFAWMLEDARPLPFFPCRGAQGLWKPTPEMIDHFKENFRA